MKNYGISYMGSKNSIVHGIVGYILDRHYDKKYFIDAFTGGFAVSHYVLHRSNKIVLANDLSNYMMGLYNEIFYNKSKEFDKVKYDFVTRDIFFDVRDNPDNYPEWYVGYVLTLWSFGNKQDTYIYGMDHQDEKEAMHEALVNNKWDNLDPKFTLPDKIKNMSYRDDIYKRILFLQQWNEHVGERVQLDHLNRIERLVDLNKIRLIDNIKALESVSYLDFINGIDADILADAVIYCDPPYEDTAEYQAGRGFNHDEFWQWFRNCPYAVYVSSYKAPDDIKPLNFELKRSLLAGGSGTLMTENLYWNGKGDPIPTMEDLLFNDDTL